jgi:hypothetical protein
MFGFFVLCCQALEAQLQSKHRIIEDLRKRLETALAMQLTSTSHATHLTNTFTLSPPRTATGMTVATAVATAKSPTTLRAEKVHAAALISLPDFASSLAMAGIGAGEGVAAVNTAVLPPPEGALAATLTPASSTASLLPLSALGLATTSVPVTPLQRKLEARFCLS